MLQNIWATILRKYVTKIVTKLAQSCHTAYLSLFRSNPPRLHFHLFFSLPLPFSLFSLDLFSFFLPFFFFSLTFSFSLPPSLSLAFNFSLSLSHVMLALTRPPTFLTKAPTEARPGKAFEGEMGDKGWSKMVRVHCFETSLAPLPSTNAFPYG